MSASGFSGLRLSGILFDPDDEQNIYIGSIDWGVSSSVPLAELPETQDGKYPIFNYLMEDRCHLRYVDTANGGKFPVS